MEDIFPELVDFSAVFHSDVGTADGTPGTRITAVQEAAANILLERVPDGSLFGEQLVTVFQRAAVKRREGIVYREGEQADDDEDAPVPSPIAAAGSMMTRALATATRKRSLQAQQEAGDPGEEEPVGANPNHDPAINCPGCNLPGVTWSKRNVFYRHLKAPSVCKDVKHPDENSPMDVTVQMNLRAAHQIRESKRPRKRAPVETSEALKPCSYCEESAAGDALMKCVSYIPISNPKEASWWKEHQPKLCDNTLHLSCVRSNKPEEYMGSVPIEEAGRNIIGFCTTCFTNMEAARAEYADATDN